LTSLFECKKGEGDIVLSLKVITEQIFCV